MGAPPPPPGSVRTRAAKLSVTRTDSNPGPQRQRHRTGRRASVHDPLRVCASGDLLAARHSHPGHLAHVDGQRPGQSGHRRWHRACYRSVGWDVDDHLDSLRHTTHLAESAELMTVPSPPGSYPRPRRPTATLFRLRTRGWPGSPAKRSARLPQRARPGRDGVACET